MPFLGVGSVVMDRLKSTSSKRGRSGSNPEDPPTTEKTKSRQVPFRREAHIALPSHYDKTDRAASPILSLKKNPMVYYIVFSYIGQEQ